MEIIGYIVGAYFGFGVIFCAYVALSVGFYIPPHGDPIWKKIIFLAATTILLWPFVARIIYNDLKEYKRNS